MLVIVNYTAKVVGAKTPRAEDYGTVTSESPIRMIYQRYVSEPMHSSLGPDFENPSGMGLSNKSRISQTRTTLGPLQGNRQTEGINRTLL